MGHPFLVGRNFIFYSTIWVVIATAHTAILHFSFSVTLTHALVDSGVYNLLFAGLGLSYWFAIRFGSFQNNSTLIFIINHVVGGLLMVGLCVLLANFIISQTQYGEELQSIERTPWKVFAGFFYYSLIVLVYYLIRYYTDLQEKISTEAKMESEVKVAELNMLKFQINPHFIFNSLNSISSLTLTRPEDARAMIVNLSSFLRYSLGNEEKSKATLKEELHNIELYLKIEKVRFGDNLNFIQEVANDTLNWPIPNMILQPLIENAIKYGVYESLEPSQLSLKATMDNSILSIEIINDFDPKGVYNKGKGIGLHNVSYRLELIYGRNDLMTTSVEGEKFLVSLKIPQWPT